MKETDLELSVVLLSLHLSPGQVEPSTTSQGRGDPLLASQSHLRHEKRDTG